MKHTLLELTTFLIIVGYLCLIALCGLVAIEYLFL